MSKCQRCGDAFPSNSVGRPRIYCTDCAPYSRRYNAKAWPQVKAKRQVRVQRNRKAVRAYLLDHPCVDCGETDYLVLQFDHQGDKERSVSYLVQQGSPLDRIFVEIAKCEVRCANCHTRRTAQQFGWKVLEF